MEKDFWFFWCFSRNWSVALIVSCNKFSLNFLRIIEVHLYCEKIKFSWIANSYKFTKKKIQFNSIIRYFAIRRSINRKRKRNGQQGHQIELQSIYVNCRIGIYLFVKYSDIPSNSSPFPYHSPASQIQRQQWWLPGRGGSNNEFILYVTMATINKLRFSSYWRTGQPNNHSRKKGNERNHNMLKARIIISILLF